MKNKSERLINEIAEIIHKEPNAELCANQIESHIFEFIEWVRENGNAFNTPDSHNYRAWTFKDSTGYDNTCGSWGLYDWWFMNIKSTPIPMFPVTSSQIKSVGYKDKLYIEFTNGSVYSYSDVPVTFFGALKTAESAGKYFASQIRGKFEFVKTDKKVEGGILK